jgi:hypothetical protein
MKRRFKFKPKLRVGILPIATNGAVRWRNAVIRSGRAWRVPKEGKSNDSERKLETL